MLHYPPSASRHSLSVSQGLLSCGEGNWQSSRGSPGPVSQGGVSKGGKSSSSGQFCAGHWRRRHWDIPKLSSQVSRFIPCSKWIQQTSADRLGILGCSGVVTEDIVLFTLWMAFIMGQKSPNLPPRGSFVPKPCLAYCALEALAPGALCGVRLLRIRLAEGVAAYGTEGSFVRDADKGKTI